MDDAIWNRLQMYALPTPGPPKSMIIAETVRALSWTMLFEIVCKSAHDPLQNHRNPWLYRRHGLHCQGRCYLESFAKVGEVLSRSTQIYDYSRDGAYTVMDNAISNRVQKYAWPTPEPSKSMIVAEMGLTLSGTMLLEIICKSRRDPVQDHPNLWL